MTKAIEAAKKIVKEPDINHLAYLKEINLASVFHDIYKMNVKITDTNLLVSFIIFAYDPDSPKIDLRKERHENKLSIAKNIGLYPTDIAEQLFINDILNNVNEDFNNVVANYLQELTDWRWQTIFALLDYHSNMMRFVKQKTETEKQFDKVGKDGAVQTLTEDYEIDKITRVNKQKGELLNQAIQARKQADELLSEIKKDFVNTDAAVQGDFNFSFTDTAKQKTDIMSWRHFIKTRNERKLLRG